MEVSKQHNEMTEHVPNSVKDQTPLKTTSVVPHEQKSEITHPQSNWSWSNKRKRERRRDEKKPYVIGPGGRKGQKRDEETKKRRQSQRGHPQMNCLKAHSYQNNMQTVTQLTFVHKNDFQQGQREKKKKMQLFLHSVCNFIKKISHFFF